MTRLSLCLALCACPKPVDPIDPIDAGPEAPPVCPTRPRLDLDPAALAIEDAVGEFEVPGPVVECGATISAVECTGPAGEVATDVSAEIADVFMQGLVNNRMGLVAVRRADVSFTPSVPGLWTVRVLWNSSDEYSRQIVVARNALATPTSFRRFVDRMDICTRGPYRTPTGLTLCQRDSTVWVYRPDGTVEQSFPGFELAVRGAEVWSNNGTELEHRTDVQGQLRDDGHIPWPASNLEGDTAPGVAFRQQPNHVLEARWDGTSLTAIAHPGIPDFSGQAFFYEGPGIWDQQACHFQPSCQQGLCSPPSARGCIWLNPATALTRDALWRLNGDVGSQIIRMQMLNRPLEWGANLAWTDLSTPSALTPGARGNGLMNPHFRTSDRLFVARRTGNTMEFTAFPTDGTLLTVTDDWALSMRDPFTLVFVSMTQ